MAIRNILVHCDSAVACRSRLTMGLQLADKFDAALTAHYAVPQISPMVFAEGGASTIVYEQELATIDEERAHVQGLFAAITEGSAVPAMWQPDELSLFDGFARAARLHDLAIVGQHDPDDARCTSHGLAAHVALAVGVPVLVLPPWEEAPGSGAAIARRPVLAWNGSREAVRALHDSLPFLTKAEEVHVLAIDGSPDELDAVCARLARHGVNAKAQAQASDGREVEDAIVEEGTVLGADLFVLGAYGHSRMREFILGGVTRGLLLDSRVPLLISH